MSRKEKLSPEQYKAMALRATPPEDRWKNGVDGANSHRTYDRTYDSLVKRGLLEYVGGPDRDDTVVPSLAGWRALRAYELAHARCDCCGEAVDGTSG